MCNKNEEEKVFYREVSTVFRCIPEQFRCESKDWRWQRAGFESAVRPKESLKGKPVVVFYLFVNVRGVLSSPFRPDEKSSTEYLKPELYMDLLVVH